MFTLREQSNLVNINMRNKIQEIFISYIKKSSMQGHFSPSLLDFSLIVYL